MEMMASEQEMMYSLILCDSGLGAGSIAHSQGLESAYQNGFVVQGTESLKGYIELVLHQTIHQALPFVDSAQSLGSRLHNQQKEGHMRWAEGIQELMAIESNCTTEFPNLAEARLLKR